MTEAMAVRRATGADLLAHGGLWWLLRIAAAACFIGHGAFGLLRKEAWLPYFAVFGISAEWAWYLMPAIGTVDIALGVSILVRPTAAVAAYMAGWGLWTALLRPLAGEPVWETLERAGNYGVPFALLLLMMPVSGMRGWLSPAPLRATSNGRLDTVRRVLVSSTALLLVGHGALGVQGKSLLVGHYAALGMPLEGAARLAPLAGWFEIALAAAILLRPTVALAAFACGWKLATEALFLVDGAPFWEFVERGGSYAAPLAVALILLGTPRRARGRVADPVRTPRKRTVAAAALVVAVVFASPLWAQRSDSAPGLLLDRLRSGGYVIVCRHAATDHDQSDRGSDRADQRNLSPAGERQARAIGSAIRARGIPIGDVRANPMYRNQETATFAFGHMTVDSALGGSNARHAVRALLAAPVPAGSNRAIVTRTGVLRGAFDGHTELRFQEGDCAVVRAAREARYGFEVLGMLRADDWSP